MRVKGSKVDYALPWLMCLVSHCLAESIGNSQQTDLFHVGCCHDSNLQPHLCLYYISFDLYVEWCDQSQQSALCTLAYEQQFDLPSIFTVLLLVMATSL